MTNINEDELQQRIKSAIKLLADGHPFKVGDLTFGCKDKKHFSITGWSLKNDLANVSKQSALNELTDIKTLFTRMTIASDELADFLKGRQIEYCLDYDYGKGANGICKETDGNLTWETELKKLKPTANSTLAQALLFFFLFEDYGKEKNLTSK